MALSRPSVDSKPLSLNASNVLVKNGLFAKTNTPDSKTYTFTGQEEAYKSFRPNWTQAFAIASLEKAGFQYDEKSNSWSCEKEQKVPVVICVGSGTGADAKPFLELGCKVYCVEPNEKFRDIASETFAKKYPKQFVNINGKAHSLNITEKVTADLIVSAQALHTYRPEFTEKKEDVVRDHWRSHLLDDAKNRVAIWYYNLDPFYPSVMALHKVLKENCIAYAESKSPLVNAEFFEPSQFQHYIEAEAMNVSTARNIDTVTITRSELEQWFKGYSFYPKSQVAQEKAMVELYKWFDTYKDNLGVITLPYIGYITQGPLRAGSFEPGNNHTVTVSSPLSTHERAKSIDNTAPFWQHIAVDKKHLVTPT